jgi:hypothetical protein
VNNFFRKIEINANIPLVMTNTPGLNAAAKAGAPEPHSQLSVAFLARCAPRIFLAQGSRRNPLKRLDPDKGIQGNPRQKFCSSLIGLVPAWPGLAKFGFRLEEQRPSPP